MMLKIKVDAKGKFEMPFQLNEGHYFLNIIDLQDKTPKGLQRHYFALVDIIVLDTGYGRYDIHNEFKQHSKIESTRDFSVEAWLQYIEDFKWFAFNNYNICI